MAVLVVAGVVGLAGCGSTSVEGQAETPQAEPGEPAFDPCSIPEEVLLQAGADPASVTRDIVGVKQPGWSVCRWRAPDYFITVLATERSIDAIRSDDRFSAFTPVDLDGREAFTFREITDRRNEFCDVLFTSGPDSLMIKSSYLTGRAPAEGPCPLAIRNARILAPSIAR
ncbi:DUF3558 domain-containing protein [Rhodococcus hoagii]|nr:DUF3558 domain-containing protein [Prescottella equi]NKS66466.1 DUF3558 domain-containing protein [Prescottella equi]